MTYAGYVVAAYAVFAGVLAADFIATRLQVRRELRAAHRRRTREASRARPERPLETP